MVNRLIVVVLGLALAGPALGDDKRVRFVGDFESGRIERNGARHNGFYIGTLPNPQSATDVIVSGDSDFGPTSNADTRVVRSEVVGGQAVMPRKGQFFLRSEVFRDKNYEKLNGDVRNKPRSKIYLSNSSHEIDFDVEGFTGFSIFVPKNFENELGVRDHRGSSVLFEICSDSSRSLVNLGVWVAEDSNQAHWFIRTTANPNSVSDSREFEQVIDLGPVSADVGKWTDFVFRFRFNPFSVATNPAAKGVEGARNKLYEGNKGILQIWKAQGDVDASGNRKMTLMVDKVNEPVGLAPHATTNIKQLWRIYKYGWLKNPTTLTHPVWFGFDEIRTGLVAENGTSFSDVAPATAVCTADCVAGVDVTPRPPNGLIID